MGRSSSRTVERRFIRHPSRVPISFVAPDGAATRQADALRNVSEGGVCFSTGQPLEVLSPIRLQIPVFGERFEVDGTVAWCRQRGRGYDVGVAFAREQDRFAVRMVEQLCYIEDYRTRIEREQGRTLSREQAAAEWVELFAGEFPDIR